MTSFEKVVIRFQARLWAVCVNYGLYKLLCARENLFKRCIHSLNEISLLVMATTDEECGHKCWLECVIACVQL